MEMLKPLSLIKYFVCVLGWMISDCNDVTANELPLFNQMQLHSFISQGYIYTNANNFFGNSQGRGTLEYTEIGANGSWRVNQKLSMTAQLLYRRAGASATNGIEIDFAVVDYRALDSSAFALGLRAGRIKNPFGLYNDTRDVLLTRSSIVLPQSIYFDRARELSLSSDGVQFYGQYHGTDHVLSMQVMTAMPRVHDENTELVFLGANRPGDLNQKISYITRITYEINQGRVVLAYTDVRLNIDYEPFDINDNNNEVGQINFSPKIFSLQINEAQWQFIAEYAQRRFSFDNIRYRSPPFDKATGESYYFQTEYRVNQQWSVFLRYDVLFQNKEDRNGALYASKTTQPAYTQFAKDLTFGAKWQISRSWMIRSEIHRVNGTAWLPIQDNIGVEPAIQRWNMFALMGAYLF